MGGLQMEEFPVAGASLLELSELEVDVREAPLRELTLRGVVLGGLITLLFTAANLLYLFPARRNDA